MINARGMYLRPGNLFKDFQVVRVEEGTRNGKKIATSEWTDSLIRGCLEEASPEEKQRWDQPQHPVTHSIVQAGPPQAKPGWILQRQGASYRINGVDIVGDLGISTIYYVEERRDSGAGSGGI